MNKLQKEMHYGKLVWVNPITESMRRDECLCLHCANLNAKPKCSVANEFYNICKANDVALMVTRCKDYRSVEDLTYEKNTVRGLVLLMPNTFSYDDLFAAMEKNGIFNKTIAIGVLSEFCERGCLTYRNGVFIHT